jgi:hypothetical protein
LAAVERLAAAFAFAAVERAAGFAFAAVVRAAGLAAERAAAGLAFAALTRVAPGLTFAAGRAAGFFAAERAAAGLALAAAVGLAAARFGAAAFFGDAALLAAALLDPELLLDELLVVPDERDDDRVAAGTARDAETLLSLSALGSWDIKQPPGVGLRARIRRAPFGAVLFLAWTPDARAGERHVFAGWTTSARAVCLDPTHALHMPRTGESYACALTIGALVGCVAPPERSTVTFTNECGRTFRCSNVVLPENTPAGCGGAAPSITQAS